MRVPEKNNEYEKFFKHAFLLRRSSFSIKNYEYRRNIYFFELKRAFEQFFVLVIFFRERKISCKSCTALPCHFGSLYCNISMVWARPTKNPWSNSIKIPITKGDGITFELSEFDQISGYESSGDGFSVDISEFEPISATNLRRNWFCLRAFLSPC